MNTIEISADDFNKLVAIANRLGWTPGGDEGTLSVALALIEYKLFPAQLDPFDVAAEAQALSNKEFPPTCGKVSSIFNGAAMSIAYGIRLAFRDDEVSVDDICAIVDTELEIFEQRLVDEVTVPFRKAHISAIEQRLQEKPE